MKKTVVLAMLAGFSGSVAAEKLPDVHVGTFNFVNETTQSAVGKIVSGTGIKIKLDGDFNQSVTASDVSGKLSSVVERLSRSVGFSYGYDGSVLTLHGSQPVAEVPADPEFGLWEASPSDRTVRAVIERWSEKAGWQKVYWYPDSDYEISAKLKLEGTFEDAIRTIIKSLDLEATVYRGNKVIVIKERG